MLKMIILLLLGYVGMGIYLYLNQRAFLYYPTPRFTTPFEEMKLQNDGECINVIVLNKGEENAILYFGGNAESIAKSSKHIASQFPRLTIYLMDYRGYGSSTGIPTEEGFYSDALRLYDTVKSKHSNISIGGRSLGSGIATYVAACREVSKLVLITPYDSVLNVAQGRFPIYPISLLLKEKYDSLDRVKDIKAKTLVVIAELDRVIPRERTQKLIEAFDWAQLDVIEIPDRGHIDISSDEKYDQIMREFIGDG
ncbi:MAG: alpha/beta hydrolase [Campylobacterota bacterium]|nr:alpha/beta hydrolase [Campylobacterota bacterium]